MVKVYDTQDDAQLKMHTDETGKFPIKAASGNQYVMVLVEIGSGAILVEPMGNRTSSEMIKTYQALVDRLHSCGIKPKRRILDNEASIEFKKCIQENGMTYQLVPPHDHRRNIAEKAIQTFKNHFVSILCGVDEKFPMSLWDKLMPQAEMTLNLLR